MTQPTQHSAQSAATLAIVQSMEAALGRRANDTHVHFHEDFLWRGNFGCGIKRGLDQFRDNWQFPFRTAFSDVVYLTEKFIADGEWAACFGSLEATHQGNFMGIPPTGKRIRMPYMDFWKIEEGRIKFNPVFVDFAAVLMQLGRDVFNGEGWESFDRGEQVAPRQW